MSKIVLNDVTNLNSLSVINDNFDKIEQEFQSKVHYRDNPEGEPNTFENDVDLNGNSIYNVENLTVANTFTVNGKNVEEVVDDAIAGVEQSALSAANSATAAANSAVSAASSATSATASAATATTKASEASTSATNAGNSATAAASSATSAASSATAAANSVTSAASSATSAGNAATIATSRAGEAATSAAAAASSQAAASVSATSSASSASSSAASAAAAALALDNFDDRYLGVKTAAPTLDNDGNALVAGALYFNSGAVTPADKGMWVYDGGTWIAASAASQSILVTYEYVATAGQTTFTGNDANGLVLSYTAGSIIVTLNGVKLRPGDDYTATNGNSVVLGVAASASDELVVDAFSTFDIANTYTQAQVDALLATKMPVNGPAFSAARATGGTQSLSAGVWTKLLFPDEGYDTNNNFTGSTFTPTVAGFYWVRVAAAQVNAGAQLGIYKNGALQAGQNAGSGSGDWLEVTSLIQCNGSTDTIEGWAMSPSGMSFIANSVLCQFQAAMIRSAV